MLSFTSSRKRMPALKSCVVRLARGGSDQVPQGALSQWDTSVVRSTYLLSVRCGARTSLCR